MANHFLVPALGRTFPLFAGLAWSFAVASSGGDGPPGAELRVRDCSVEYLQNPIALDSPAPRLSWRLAPTEKGLRNLRQSAYRVLVASSPALLSPGAADLWDSGPVASDRSHLVVYAGVPLSSRQVCYWTVRIWDGKGRASAWSDPARWRMGLMNPDDWLGSSWIEPDAPAGDRSPVSRPFQTERMDGPEPRHSYPSPLMRRSFHVDKPVVSALAYVIGLGYHELYVNGRRIGDHVLDPGQTSYDVHAFYVTHDVTEQVRQGGNVVGLWLGNGFYGQTIAFGPQLGYGPPCARVVLCIEYGDGTVERVISDRQWTAAQSPVVFDNVYAGETYDARLEQPGWSAPGFDDGSWSPVRVIDGPTDRLESQSLPPMRRTQVLQPSEIWQIGPDRWIVDFGQNIAGWVRVTLQESEGTTVTVTTTEHVMPDRSSVDPASTGGFATGVVQQDVYRCRGQGPETWEPRFTYHGFRYAEIQGPTQPPTSSMVVGVVVHTDVEPRGSFTCSDPLLNRMVDVSLWTIRDNLHSVPEDCPHREKCGWTGDAHLVAESQIFHFDMARFLAKYLVDMEGVLGRGGRPAMGASAPAGRIPTMCAPGKRLCGQATADWGVAIVLLPWYLYQYYGDQAVLDRFYPPMKVWAEFEWGLVKDGLLHHGLGDWCPPRWDRKTNPGAMACDPKISATLLYADALGRIVNIARSQGDPDFADWCLSRRRELLGAFTRRTLKPLEGGGGLTLGSQTADVMALRLNLLSAEDGHVGEVLQGLVRRIEYLHDGHHNCGVFGLKHLFTVLCENGNDDLAYRVLTNPEFPSHAYMLSKGLTTWPERQQEIDLTKPFGNRSFNHPFHSGFLATFHEAVAGIRPDPQVPGFGRLIMKPSMLGRLAWVRATHESPHGTIRSAWELEDDRFTWEIELPANTTARIQVPGREIVEQGGATPPGGSSNGFDVGSGTYRFVSTWERGE